jgi:hypothetical protein
MATEDGLKLDAVSELRDLSARAAKAFDAINGWLIKNNRFGYVPDDIGGNPEDPITTEDMSGTGHEGITQEVLYGVIAFWATTVKDINANPTAAKMLARFGKPMSQQ